MCGLLRQLRSVLAGELRITDPIKYRMVIYAIAAIHGFLMLFFIITHIPFLLWYNFFSTLLYFCCQKLIQAERYPLIFFISCGEILVHSMLSVFLTGWNTGFCMFLIALVPASFYISYTFPNKGLKTAILTGVLSALVFLCCYVVSEIVTPVYALSSLAVHIVYFFNTFCTFGVLTVFSMLFIIDVRKAQNDLRRENQSLVRIARIDALTGLYNRWSMQDYMQAAVKNRMAFCLIMCDIDDFKHINDTYGHEVGDLVLKNIARIICEKIPKTDYVCRWGGEEILILLHNHTLKEAYCLAEKIRAAVAETKTVFQEYFISHTITMGIAEHNHNQSLEQTISVADTRLYAGKHRGKNVVV